MSLKIVLVNMVTILMMSAKIDTLGFLKRKEFWNKGYDVANEILLRDSNFLVDVVMWPKFD